MISYVPVRPAKDASVSCGTIAPRPKIQAPRGKVHALAIAKLGIDVTLRSRVEGQVQTELAAHGQSAQAVGDMRRPRIVYTLGSPTPGILDEWQIHVEVFIVDEGAASSPA